MVIWKKRAGVRTRQIATLVALGLLIAAVAGVLIWKSRDTGRRSAEEAAVLWAFENGSGQVFRAAGNGMASASSAGFQLLDASGGTVTRQVYSLGSPALAVCGGNIACWDVGGTELRLYDGKGGETPVAIDKPLISVTLSESGHMAVCSEEAGYKGVVTVYDAGHTPVYRWHSGSGYLVTARVSPDGGRLAAVTVGESGGEVHIFSLSSEEEQGRFSAENEVISDLCWFSSSRLCAITRQRVVFLDTDGKAAGAYGFNGLTLTGCAMDGDGFLALALSRYSSGATELVVTLSGDGDTLGQLEPGESVLRLCANGKKLAVLCRNSAYVYTSRMEKVASLDGLSAVRDILLRELGDALLIGTYQAREWKY